MSAQRPKFGNANKQKASDQVAERKAAPRNPGQQQVGDARIQQIRDDVEEAQAIMADNVQNMIENIEKAEDIEEQTNRLRDNADQFKKGAGKLKKTMWWRNVKLWIILILVVVVIIAVIALIIGLSVGLKKDKPAENTNTNTDTTTKSTADALMSVAHMLKYITVK